MFCTLRAVLIMVYIANIHEASSTCASCVLPRVNGVLDNRNAVLMVAAEHVSSQVRVACHSSLSGSLHFVTYYSFFHAHFTDNQIDVRSTLGLYRRSSQ